MDCSTESYSCQAKIRFDLHAAKSCPVLQNAHIKEAVPNRDSIQSTFLLDQRQARGGYGLAYAAAGFIGNVQLHLGCELGVFGFEDFLGFGKEDLSTGTGGDAAHDEDMSDVIELGIVGKLFLSFCRKK